MLQTVPLEIDIFIFFFKISIRLKKTRKTQLNRWIQIRNIRQHAISMQITDR